MFEIKVRAKDEAEILTELGWPTRIISVVSPHVAATINSAGDHHLIVGMEDVAHVHAQNAPRLSDIENILEFVSDLNDHDRVLVHCHLGQSRSTAVAIGILIKHGMAPLDAFEKITTERDIALPNMLICQHLDVLFGLDRVLQQRNSDHLMAYLRARPYGR